MNGPHRDPAVRHDAPGVDPVSSESALPADTGPVTTTVTRRIKPGHEAAYEAFLAGISGAAAAFPGYLGVEVFRPTPGGQGGEYWTVYRFDSPAHLRAWLDSPERAAWRERTEPHVAGPIRTWVLVRLQGWFTQPTTPPPRYKMAVVTWVTWSGSTPSLDQVSLGQVRSSPVRSATNTSSPASRSGWPVSSPYTRLPSGWGTRGCSRPG
jgi:heme-degrading monooxygenase HmoA